MTQRQRQTTVLGRLNFDVQEYSDSFLLCVGIIRSASESLENFGVDDFNDLSRSQFTSICDSLLIEFGLEDFDAMYALLSSVFLINTNFKEIKAKSRILKKTPRAKVQASISTRTVSDLMSQYQQDVVNFLEYLIEIRNKDPLLES